jgi:hypothetical protein
VSDELKVIALETLQAVAGDAGAPAAARAAAARTLLEMLGYIGRLQDKNSQNDKDLQELSRGELDSEIDRLQRRLKAASLGSVTGSRKPRRGNVIDIKDVGKPRLPSRRGTPSPDDNPG